MKTLAGANNVRGYKILSFGASPEEQAEAFTFLAYTGRYALSDGK